MTRKRLLTGKRRCFAWVALGCALCAFSAFAQAPDRASLRGCVLGEYGGALGGASVAATNASTGMARSTVTDGGGRFALLDLPVAGKYYLRITKAGFAPGGFRQIVTYVNEDNANYDALQANVKRDFGHLSIFASYTYSHTIDTVDWDAPQQNPNDFNQLGKYERGDSLFDQRHRAVVSAWWLLPRGFSAGGVASAGSGMPYNITTGADNNGDGSRSDRPVINGAVIGRNAGRGRAVYDFSPFVEKTLSFSDRARMTLRAEAFNVFNHANIYGRNGVYGNAADGAPLPSFGQPLGGAGNVDPGREFQFMVEVGF
ncbi:MAG: carboxypeptidase regulatory-like domain-containing protein [Acidobacteriota bacterium]|nr:carboxypeptidase regulatory-like domain-containing protein [Acidobacteriota bacterium]